VSGAVVAHGGGWGIVIEVFPLVGLAALGAAVWFRARRRDPQ
jgi:hypothetical protein